MTDEKWQDTIGRIKDSFSVLEEKQEINPEMGVDKREWIVFSPSGRSPVGGQGPLGKIKLERTTRPVVLGKKTIGSKRIGSQTKVEYVYSEEEKIQKVRAYKWDEAKNGWEEIKDAGPSRFFG